MFVTPSVCARVTLANCTLIDQRGRGVVRTRWGIGEPYVGSWRRSRTHWATSLTWMLVTSSGPRALHPQRSGQNRHRWERAARGGRAGGARIPGKEDNVTIC